MNFQRVTTTTAATIPEHIFCQIPLNELFTCCVLRPSAVHATRFQRLPSDRVTHKKYSTLSGKQRVFYYSPRSPYSTSRVHATSSVAGCELFERFFPLSIQPSYCLSHSGQLAAAASWTTTTTTLTDWITTLLLDFVHPIIYVLLLWPHLHSPGIFVQSEIEVYIFSSRKRGGFRKQHTHSHCR